VDAAAGDESQYDMKIALEMEERMVAFERELALDSDDD